MAGRRCRRNRAWIRAQWQSHVSAQAQSGQTARDYCVAHGLSTTNFYRWRKRLGGADPSPGADSGTGEAQSRLLFAEVPLAAAPPTSFGETLEVVVRGDRRIRLCVDFDEETLRRAVRVLEALPC